MFLILIFFTIICDGEIYVTTLYGSLS